MERDIDELKFLCESKEYALEDFFKEFKDDLPKLVMITEGYYGDIGLDKIESNQAIRLHTYSRQRRIIADVTKGWEQFSSKRISIPLDYNLMFHIYKDSKRSLKVYTLRKIVEKYQLPVTVEYTGRDTHTSETSGPQFASRSFRLHLFKMYDDIYLLGNMVTETHLYERTIEIPLYLKSVRLRIIHGMKGFRGEWSKFQKMMDDRVYRNVKFNPNFGNPDIAIYQDHIEDKDDYCYVAPTEYTMIERRGSEHTYTKMSESTYKSSALHAILPKAKSQETLPNDDMKPFTVERYTKFLAGRPPKVLNSGKHLSERSKDKEEFPPPLPPRQSKGPSESDSDLSVRHRSREVQMSTVPDNSSPLVDELSHRLQAMSSKPDKRKTSLEKAKIKDLTVLEVCELLDVLKLSKYKAVFRENMIDGFLLADLSDDMMTEEMGMNKFEALKLRKFATEGHIPKL